MPHRNQPWPPAMLRIYVSCHNYEAFLQECLSSVARQTAGDFVCTVVDDGSTDRSFELAAAFAAADSRFRALRQENAGQLSVFNRAAAEVADDDLVFFLDADDAWADDHLAIVAACLRGRLAGCELAFVDAHAAERFEPFRYGALSPPCQELGTTSGVVRGFSTWIGNVTSTVCIRGKLLKRILPYPYDFEWKIRADDCLLLGASVVGIVKGYIAASTVFYRTHGRNNFVGGDTSGRNELPSYRLAKERFVNWLCDRESLDRVPSFRLVLAELARSDAWLPHSPSGIFPESALVMPWPLVKRIEVFVAMLRARTRRRRLHRARR